MAVIALVVAGCVAHAAMIANHRSLLFGNAVLPFNGTPFYFNASLGSDSNNCQTPATACQTVSHLNAIALPANAVVLFNGGQTFSGGISLTAANVPQGPVTFTRYGNGNPTISSGLSACFLAANISNVTVNGLNCTGSGNTSNGTAGISVINGLSGNKTLAGVTVTNNTVTGYGFDGIDVLGNNGTSGFSGITVNGNVVHDVTGNSGTTPLTACIKIGAGVSATNTSPSLHANGSVQGNTVYNCTGKSTGTNGTGSGIFVENITTATLQHNVAHDFGVNSATAGGPVGIWTAVSNNVTIQFNETYNGKTAGGDGDGIDCDGAVTNCIIQYNFSHDNFGAGIMACSYSSPPGGTNSNTTVRYNITQNNNSFSGLAEIFVCGTTSVTGLAIYNNTVYAGVSGLALKESLGTAPSGNVANNIFFGVSGDVLVNWADTVSINLTGNDYYPSSGVSINWAGTSYASFSAWQTATGQEKISGSNVGHTNNPQIYVPGGGFIGNGGGYDPTLLMAYNLQVGSPVSTVGLDLDARFSIIPGAQDFYGNAIQTTGGTYPVGAALGDFSIFATSCPASTNYLARVSGFSKLANVNYNSLLCGMNSDGDLANIDALYMLAAPSSTAAALNLVSTSDSLVSHGTITFSANQGYTGDGATGYLDTQFIPSSAGGHYVQNSATIGVYVTNARTVSGNMADIAGGDVNSYSLIEALDGTIALFAVNENGSGDFPANTNSQGSWMAQRTSSSAQQGYKNGTTFGSVNTDASTGLSTVSDYICALNSSGTATDFCADTIASALIGGPFSVPRTSRRLNSFMTAIGINVY